MWLTRLWYPRIWGHTSILWTSRTWHSVVGWVGRVTSLPPLWIPLGVASFHLRTLAGVARLPRVVLWNGLLLRVSRVLAWVAPTVAGMPWTWGTTLFVVALGHWLAWMSVHLLLHLLLLLPGHVARVALLTRISWLAWLALVTRVPWLTLARSTAARRVARRCSRTICAIAWWVLPTLTTSTAILVLVAIALWHLLCSWMALHLLWVASLLQLLLAPRPQHFHLAGGSRILGPSAVDLFRAPGAKAAEVAQAVQPCQVISKKI